MSERNSPKIKPKQKQKVSVKFRLGICGNDEEHMALPYKANGAAESFWILFAEKSILSWPAQEGRKAKSALFHKSYNIIVDNAIGHKPLRPS